MSDGANVCVATGDAEFWMDVAGRRLNRAEEAEIELSAIDDALDEFSPAHRGGTLAEAVVAMRVSFVQSRAAALARAERAEAERDEARAELRRLLVLLAATSDQ